MSTFNFPTVVIIYCCFFPQVWQNLVMVKSKNCNGKEKMQVMQRHDKLPNQDTHTHKMRGEQAVLSLTPNQKKVKY